MKSYSETDMKRILYFVLVLFILLSSSAGADVLSRIKDISSIDGVRENQLIGYGLVTGLRGTGDKSNTFFTVQSTVNILREFGVFVDPLLVRTKNIAAVMVTATLPPFTRPGSRIDVTVSSFGDAKSLQGGTLIMTPLKAGNGKIYAVAQGGVSIGGFSVKGKRGGSIQKNHVTVGRIPGGALIERDSSVNLLKQSSFNIILKEYDFNTAARVAYVINRDMKESIAYPLDGKNIKVAIPKEFENDIVELIAAVRSLHVEVDTPAKVVFNERTGTVIIGSNVRVSAVAISHGGLTIEIKSTPVVSQPQPLSPQGKTVTSAEEKITAKEKKGEFILLSDGVSVSKIVGALNAIGATPRDIIAIFQAMDNAGALHAKLVIL